MGTILQTSTEEWSSPWAQPMRPWLTLYGLRVKQQREVPKEEVCPAMPVPFKQLLSEGSQVHLH